MKTFIILITFCILTTAARDVKKCSACEAVAAELSHRLANERPRNHLDVRHRLDKDGKRYGKVINFAISELRAIELMDGLCSEMEKYHLESSTSSGSSSSSSSSSETAESNKEERWVLSSDALDKDSNNNSNSNPHLLKEQRRLLRNTCADILGRWEDDLADAIKEGEADAESVTEVLCVKLGKYCAAEERDVGKGKKAWRKAPSDEL